MKKLFLSTVLTLLVGFGVKTAAQNIDAASFSGTDGFNNKIYFFKDNAYWRWDMEADVLDQNYPKEINVGWAGLPNDIGAATFSGNDSRYPNKIYAFKGEQYWRWDMVKDELDAGYPKPIQIGWPGIPSNIDAATFSGTNGFYNKIYFFKGDLYWRWDMAKDKLDENYPKRISAGWAGLPNDIDAAVFSGFESKYPNKIYFFKDNLYWRWDMTVDQLDAGYPKEISAGWSGIFQAGNPIRKGVFQGVWEDAGVFTIDHVDAEGGHFTGSVTLTEGRNKNYLITFTGKIAEDYAITLTRTDTWEGKQILQVCEAGSPEYTAEGLLWKGVMTGEAMDLPFELRIPTLEK